MRGLRSQKWHEQNEEITTGRPLNYRPDTESVYLTMSYCATFWKSLSHSSAFLWSLINFMAFHLKRRRRIWMPLRRRRRNWPIRGIPHTLEACDWWHRLDGTHLLQWPRSCTDHITPRVWPGSPVASCQLRVVVETVCQNTSHNQLIGQPTSDDQLPSVAFISMQMQIAPILYLANTPLLFLNGCNVFRCLLFCN